MNCSVKSSHDVLFFDHVHTRNTALMCTGEEMLKYKSIVVVPRGPHEDKGQGVRMVLQRAKIAFFGRK